MADKRGKDYNKRLDYDQLTEKITKKKVPINAPYRTGTVIRNSNQMQNLLQMNNLDMEEHQAGLEKEQIKQAKVGEVLSNKQEVKEPKKQMKNVGVDATKELKTRFTQAGFKTADVGVSATQQTRSTASGSTEPRVIHNSAQTMDESDMLQDQMDESISLLNQAQLGNQQSAINQLTSSTNLAHQMVKGKGKGKEKGAYAMDAFQSGFAIDTTIYGGGQSSSSGMQPMDQSIGQQKRSELGDTGSSETKNAVEQNEVMNW